MDPAPPKGPDIQALTEKLRTAAQRLRQFGRLSASRMFGTLLATDGRYKAVVGMEERGLFARAELNALVRLLVDKGVFTEAEWTERVAAEMEHLAAEHAKQWPELRAEPDGIHVHDLPRHAKRSRDERWPP